MQKRKKKNEQHFVFLSLTVCEPEWRMRITMCENLYVYESISNEREENMSHKYKSRIGVLCYSRGATYDSHELSQYSMIINCSRSCFRSLVAYNLTMILTFQLCVTFPIRFKSNVLLILPCESKYNCKWFIFKMELMQNWNKNLWNFSGKFALSFDKCPIKTWAK